jgi:type III secretion system YscQ/HrcQ family protein
MAVETRLASYRTADLPLWNWFVQAFPGAGAWERWLGEVAGALLQRPGALRVRLERSNVTDSKSAGTELRLGDEPLTFGRDESNRVVLPEPAITRHHARLFREGGRLILEDLDSSMGTMVNGRRMMATGRAELGDGDEFVIFPHRFVVRLEREWTAETAVKVGEAFSCPGEGDEFHASVPVGWSVFPLRVEPVGAVFSLVVADALLEGLCERALAPLGPRPAGLTPGREAVIELLLLAALERANRELAMPFQFSLGRRGRRAVVTGEGLAAGATLQLSDLRGAFRVFLPRVAMERMRAAWAGPKAAPPEEIGWRLRCSTGSVVLTPAEMASLEVGDVVLFERRCAVLYPGRDDAGWWAVRTGTGQFKLETKMAIETPTVLDELPLRLHVVIDDKELSWAEVARLTVGSVIELGREPREPVQLAVNGRLVGTGELVEIEGRLGVKVLSWGSAG